MRVIDPACAGDSHNRWFNFWGARQLDQVFSFVPGERENEEKQSPNGSIVADESAGGRDVAVVNQLENYRNDPMEMVRKTVIAHTEAGNGGKIAIDLFSDSVNYFGRKLNREEIVLDEIIYAFRWNKKRSFSINGDIKVTDLGGNRYRAKCKKNFHTIGRNEWNRGNVAAVYEIEVRGGVPLISDFYSEGVTSESSPGGVPPFFEPTLMRV